MIIIGIVGSPASGKSTVAKRLETLGGTWIHADSIAKEILDEPKIRALVIQHFGSQIQGDEGSIDRQKLAKAVFGDGEEKRRSLTYLESILHPETKKRISKEIGLAKSTDCPLIALEIPLMFESQWDLVCDEIWCVDAPIARRIAWAQARNWTSEDLRKRESNQIALKIKKELSNLVIINDKDRAALESIVDQRWVHLMSASRTPSTTHCTPPSRTHGSSA
ncbi:MAG: dephospho-CoA kinase, partial [Planctomycetota bacterium]|nr:dephospho-CoA kinase [Planctomycetota bacterium]